VIGCLIKMSNIIDTESKGVLDFSGSYFNPPNFDLRYNSTAFHQFYPLNGLSESTETISFILPSYVGPLTYDLDNIFISAGILLSEESGPIPYDTELSVINNCLLSAFKAVRVYVNGEILVNHSKYSLFAYLNTLLNFPDAPKLTYLESAGWVKDELGQFNSFGKTSKGYEARKLFFATKVAGVTRFKLDPTKFFGKLLLGHNMGTVIPGTEIRIELDKQNDPYYFLTADTKKYKFQFKSLCLYAATRKLNDSLYLSIKKEIQTKNANFYLTIPSIYQYTIPGNVTTFINDSLNYTNHPPSRIILMLQPTNYHQGKQDKNPYKFSRSFTNFYIKNVNVFLNNESLDGFIEQNDKGKMDYLRMFYMSGQFFETSCTNITYK
jgi:hypothetical protein